jgi:hypothetical protein
MRVLKLLIPVLVLALGPSAQGAEPPWLPRYELGIDLDVAARRATVVQNVTWTNRTDKPVDDVVFNVHSRFTPPKGERERYLLGRLTELFRQRAGEVIFDEPAFNLRKVERLVPRGKDWVAEVAKHQYHPKLDTALVVALAEPVAPGGTVRLSLTYTMELPEKQWRWGQWKGVTFLTNWHPVLAFHDAANGWQPTPFVPWHQPFFNEAGLYNVRLRIPKDQVLACTGSVTKVEENETTKVMTVGPVVARDWSFLVSNRYQEFTGQAGPVRIRCLAFPENADFAVKLVAQAERAIAGFSQWFGAYPYPEFTIAESYFGWNGNECPGLVMIDERVFNMPRGSDGYIQYLLTHEICHQWFYNVIGTDGYHETFMDEAFATHFAHRLLDRQVGKNNTLITYPRYFEFLPEIKRENYRNAMFYSVLRNGDLNPAVMDLEKYGSPINLFASVYDRGSKIVGTIEDRIGEAAFLDFMRRIYAKYYFRVIKVADFQEELEEYTGRKWDDFFKDWLTTKGMSDWSVAGVELAPGNGTTRTSAVVRQLGEITESTTVGFSFDGGSTYPVRVPLAARAGMEQPGGAQVVPLGNNHYLVEVDLPEAPTQVSVDPDQVLPDAQPANNHWKEPVSVRKTPFYTFLDETNFANDYDRWNVIAGPFFYGAAYAEAWFTRSSVLGGRVGAFRTEEFRGGAYAGYRPTFGDLAVGVDALWQHFPGPKMEAGFHAEKSVAPFLATDDFHPDRVVGYVRHIIEPSSSLYLLPNEYAEAYVGYQRRWLPIPRHRIDGAIDIDPLTTIGLHYRKDTLIPYWDAESGLRFDANYSLGLPVFSQNHTTHQAWAQASYTFPLSDVGLLSDCKLAVRALGMAGLPSRGRLFALGGNMGFRGFDFAERQGNLGWVGSVELRVPLLRDLDYDVAERLARLRNVTVAPFYDIGDMYSNGRSYGPVAHAVGLGLRFDVAFFSFLDRASIRVDIAKATNGNSGTQFWLGVQHPF